MHLNIAIYSLVVQGNYIIRNKLTVNNACMDTQLVQTQLLLLYNLCEGYVEFKSTPVKPYIKEKTGSIW